ncbi:MAG: hypothetical protein RR977_05250 [Oscillospiraceae bacterium]
MLHLRPLKDGDHFEKLSGGLFYVALEGDKLLGFCKYRKDGDCVLIEQMEDGGDIDLFDGLLRAVFAYVLEVGINRARMSEQLDFEKLKKLLVPLDENHCINSLRDFLFHCKKCKML